MSGILFYNSYDIFNNPYNKNNLKNIPGGSAFSSFFQIFSQNITAVDRSGVITTPLNVKVPEYLKLIEYKKFDKDFTSICDDRAKYLLELAESKNKKIAVMYSGGVDSTLVLCSLLKNATEKQLKLVIVLLSDESIMENENFYRDFIIKKFNCMSSYRFPYILGNDDYIFTSGENADQLFGSQVNSHFTQNNPVESLFKNINEVEERILDFFRDRLREENKRYAEPILDLFYKSVAAAPIELNNVYKFFWWINFTTKWQNVYVRMFPYSTNIKGIKPEQNYNTFFNNEEFQLWSMNNVDKFASDVDRCGKIVPKQYILDVNGDRSYLNKPKIGSLAHIVKRKEVVYTVSDSMEISNDYPTRDLYNYDNDFEKMK